MIRGSEDAGQQNFFPCGGHQQLLDAVSVPTGACCQSIVVRLLRTAVSISCCLETDGSKFFFACGGRDSVVRHGTWCGACLVDGQAGFSFAVMKGRVSVTDDHDYNLKCFNISTNLSCD